MTRKWILIVFLVSVAGLSGWASAEDHAGTANSGTVPAGTSGDRPAAPAEKLRDDKELKFLGENFTVVGKDYISSKYGTTLPVWLRNARERNDENDTAKTMADLFSRFSEEQRNKGDIAKIVKNAEEERAKHQGPPRDEKFTSLLDRVVWAGNAVEGKLSKLPEAQEFLKKFVGDNLDFKSGAFKTQIEENGQTKQKIASAAAGNEADKKWVRENVNREAALNFAASHKGTEISKNLVQGISWNRGGSMFVDMIGAGNTPARLVFGKNAADIPAVLTAWVEKKGAFPPVAAVEQKVADDKTWYAVNNGGRWELKQGRPGDFPADPATPSQGAPATGTATASGGLDQPKLATFAQMNCQKSGCHSSVTASGSNINDLRLVVDGAPKKFSEVVAKVDSVAKMRDGLPDAVKTQLKTWADQQK